MKTASLKQRKPLERKTPMARTGMLRVAAVQFKSRAVAGKVEEGQPKARKLKSRGTKGRTPTAAEKRFMDAIAALGCVACAKDGVVNPWISLHHIDGRTKPGAHLLVLPLCAPHHQQDDTDPLQRPSVHGRKETFTTRYGTELELLAEAKQRLSLEEH